MQKKYVSVNAEVDTDGVIRPLLICMHDYQACLGGELPV